MLVLSSKKKIAHKHHKQNHEKHTLGKNINKNNKISTFPSPRLVPRTTPDDQNHPREPPGPPPDTLRKPSVFSVPPGPSPRSPRGLPGTPQRPPGTPQRRRGPSQGSPGKSQRPPRTPRGNPREPEDLLRTRQRSQGTPQTLSSRPGGMREAIKSAAPCQSREQGVSKI